MRASLIHTLRVRPSCERLEPREVPSFSPSALHSIGQFPAGVAVTDVNRDGFQDVVTALNNEHKISVLFGDGSGTFGAPVKFISGRYPVGLRVSDFDADGRVDVVTANRGDSTVSILLGNGNGTFKPHKQFNAGIAPAELATGDINGDGKTDLAVTNWLNAGTVTLLFGNGNGTFQAPKPMGVGSRPRSVGIADLNGDGSADLTVDNRDSQTLSVLMNTGNGTFPSTITYPLGGRSWGHTLGDVNGDNRPDVIVGKEGGAVSVLLNNGNGTYQPRADYLTGGANACFPILADFNDDDRFDIAAASCNAGTLSVLDGNGDGTFKAHITYTAGLKLQALAGGDLTNDQFPDIVATDQTTGTANIFVNDDNSRAESPVGPPNGQISPTLNVGDASPTPIPSTAESGASTDPASKTITRSTGTIFRKSRPSKPIVVAVFASELLQLTASIH